VNPAEAQPALGTNHNPPAAFVGGFVYGSLYAQRQVVQAEALYRAYHENEIPETLDNREAYSTVYQYPIAEYREHIRANDSPKGYAGPASCGRLVWDIDRNDLDAALDDTRHLVRFLRERYGDRADWGLGVYFSGSKGFHVTLIAPHNGLDSRPAVPSTMKTLCTAIARNAGVRVDPEVYDHQRLLRLPNSRHPKTGLFKTFLDLDDLDRLGVKRIREMAKQPRGAAVPMTNADSPDLSEDWFQAETRPFGNRTVGSVRLPPSSCPVVPLYVRDFIGFGDIVGESRAVTLFRCAAVLMESFTKFGPAAVITGLLEEVALKSGLEAWEVEKQLRDGIAAGTKSGEKPCECP